MAAHLPVEGSWRMVEGANDSFDTSVVPAAFPHEETDVDTESVALSSQQPPSTPPPFSSPPSLPGRSGLGVGGDDSFVSGSGSGSVSAGGSQDDDIHAFLRKAEDDDRVLLRSPFQPSLPSSVRQQSPRSTTIISRQFDCDCGAYQMPADGSVHEEEGSPVRRRPGKEDKAGCAQDSSSSTTTTTTTTTTTIPPQAATPAWHRHRVLSILLGLAAVYGAVGCCGRGTLGIVGGLGSNYVPSLLCTNSQLCSVTINTVCSIPGVASWSLAVCSPSSGVHDADDATDDADTNDNSALQQSSHHLTTEEPPSSSAEQGPVSLVRCVGDLMRAQLQLATVVRTRILPSRHYKNNAAAVPEAGEAAVMILPAHDACRVPRLRTGDLLVAAQMEEQQQPQQQQTPGPVLLLLELEAYLDAARRVSAALSGLQTGAAATAADTLAYSTRRTLAQLRRINEHIKASNAGSGGSDDDDKGPRSSWLSRLLSSLSSSTGDSYASAGRRRALLADAYRHHAKTLLAKTRERVREAAAVLRELEAADKHLRIVQHYVDARIGGGSDVTTDVPDAFQKECSTNPLVAWSWFWNWFRADDADDVPGPSSGDGPASSSAHRSSRQARQWAGYAEQLATLRHEHDASVRQTVDALDELAGVRDALAQLQAWMGGDGDGDVAFTTDELDLDMQLHMDIVEAGLHDLELFS